MLLKRLNELYRNKVNNIYDNPNLEIEIKYGVSNTQRANGGYPNNTLYDNVEEKMKGGNINNINEWRNDINKFINLVKTNDYNTAYDTLNEIFNFMLNNKELINDNLDIEDRKKLIDLTNKRINVLKANVDNSKERQLKLIKNRITSLIIEWDKNPVNQTDRARDKQKIIDTQEKFREENTGADTKGDKTADKIEKILSEKGYTKNERTKFLKDYFEELKNVDMGFLEMRKTRDDFVKDMRKADLNTNEYQALKDKMQSFDEGGITDLVLNTLPENSKKLITEVAKFLKDKVPTGKDEVDKAQKIAETITDFFLKIAGQTDKVNSIFGLYQKLRKDGLMVSYFGDNIKDRFSDKNKYNTSKSGALKREVEIQKKFLSKAESKNKGGNKPQSDKRKKRALLIKKIMKERNLNLPNASKYIKKNNLY